MSSRGLGGLDLLVVLLYERLCKCSEVKVNRTFIAHCMGCWTGRHGRKLENLLMEVCLLFILFCCNYCSGEQCSGIEMLGARKI